MKVYCPQSPNYPLVKLTAVAGNWTTSSLSDQSHLLGEIDVPSHIHEDEVTVTAQFCNGRGEPQLPGIIVKEATKKAAVKAKVEPKPETKDEAKVETKIAEAKTETKVEVKPEVKPAVTLGTTTAS